MTWLYFPEYSETERGCDKMSADVILSYAWIRYVGLGWVGEEEDLLSGRNPSNIQWLSTRMWSVKSYPDSAYLPKKVFLLRGLYWSVHTTTFIFRLADTILAMGVSRIRESHKNIRNKRITCVHYTWHMSLELEQESPSHHLNQCNVATMVNDRF